ncbi:hypothetical protein [Bradyrhizobium sp. 23AC]
MRLSVEGPGRAVQFIVIARHLQQISLKESIAFGASLPVLAYGEVW